MSVLFATISKDSIILCADKLATHSQTGEAQAEPVTKIEKWSPTIAVGGTGITTLCDIIKSTVHDLVEENGLNTYSLEDIADLFGQCYYAAREEYTDMPKATHAEFVVAGILSSGKVGLVQVLVGNDEADIEVIEAKTKPATVIQSPADMTYEECNQLLQKAIRNTINKNSYQRDFMEVVHRKAVRYVSERSKFVGPKADYIVIKP